MGLDSLIEWTDWSWNPIAAFDKETGKRGWFCAHASPGCLKCYAETRNKNTFFGNGLAYIAQNKDKVEIRLVNELEPLKRKKPRYIFLNSMTDTFLPLTNSKGEMLHSYTMLDTLFAVMWFADWHTFQVLTKHPGRMRHYLTGVSTPSRIREAALQLVKNETLPLSLKERYKKSEMLESEAWWCRNQWPIKNIWLGTTAEDDEWAQKRIPELLAIPWDFHWISYEPAIGGINWQKWWFMSDMLQYMRSRVERGETLLPTELNLEQARRRIGDNRLNLVIWGGESGAGARPADIAWARECRDWCQHDACAFFCKQLGSNPVRSLDFNDNPADIALPVAIPFDNPYNAPATLLLKDKKGGDISQWPPDLQIRNLPSPYNPQRNEAIERAQIEAHIRFLIEHQEARFV